MKKIYFVGALLIASMSAMLVSCDKNSPANGCKCTVEVYGDKETKAITTVDMINNYGVQSCGALKDMLQDELIAEGAKSAKVSCSGY